MLRFKKDKIMILYDIWSVNTSYDPEIGLITEEFKKLKMAKLKRLHKHQATGFRVVMKRVVNNMIKCIWRMSTIFKILLKWKK